MIDRPAGAYVTTESGLEPDLKDKAMAEKSRDQGKDIPAQTEDRAGGFEPMEPFDQTNPLKEKVCKPKKKEVKNNATVKDEGSDTGKN